MNGQLYKVLRISPTADASTIRTAYRRAALLAHPDKGGSEAHFHLIALAFETLSNKASREAYDKLHGTAHCQEVSSPCRNRKRLNTRCNDYGCPMPKRQKTSCVGSCRDESMLRQPRSGVSGQASRRAKVLGHLRAVLQSLDATQRREAMTSVEPRIQSALLVYMQAQTNVEHSAPRNKSGSQQARSRPGAGELQKGHVWTKSGVSGVHKIGPSSYRASVAFANLEVYSRVRPRLAMAIDDHIVLAQVKEVILLNMDQSNESILASCRRCLRESGTSEEEIQFRAKVRVRAGNMMGPMRISSRAVPFEEALALRSRLLVSKQLSWQSFRSECVSLFQRTRRFRGKRTYRTPAEAEAIADKAWAEASSRRRLAEAARKRLLARVVRAVTSVLNSEERRAAREKARLEAVQKRRTQAEERRTREALRRWSRKRDVTMEEMTRGPPIAGHSN